MPSPASVAVATSHRICCRSSPRARRKRCHAATTVARLAPSIMNTPMPTSAFAGRPSANGERPKGFA